MWRVPFRSLLGETPIWMGASETFGKNFPRGIKETMAKGGYYTFFVFWNLGGGGETLIFLIFVCVGFSSRLFLQTLLFFKFVVSERRPEFLLGVSMGCGGGKSNFKKAKGKGFLSSLAEKILFRPYGQTYQLIIYTITPFSFSPPLRNKTKGGALFVWNGLTLPPRLYGGAIVKRFLNSKYIGSLDTLGRSFFLITNN